MFLNYAFIKFGRGGGGGGGGGGGWGVSPPPWNLQLKLNIADITGNEKKIVIT